MRKALVTTTFYLFSCALATAQASYEFKPFQNPGAATTRAFGLNGLGKIVGTDDAIPGLHAFLADRDGSVSLDRLGVLGTHTSFARGINTKGEIVGGYAGSDGKEHGFIIRQGKVIKFDVPLRQAVGTQLNALNDAGAMVGVWIDAGFRGHGFIYQNGKLTSLEYPGARDTNPFGINSHGDVVGNWDTDQSHTGHGFVFINGQIKSFDVPSAEPLGTAANGLNDQGQIVGSYVGHDGHFHGFLQEGPTFTTLDCPGAMNTIAWAINANGEIVGDCNDATGRKAFIASRRSGKKP
jgi:uncharacterized membrane protein